MRFRSALIFLIAWWGYAGTLTVGDLTLDPDETGSLQIRLVGGSQISALQFDIVVPDEQALGFGDVQRGAALGPHRMVYNGANYRTVTYSPASDVLSNGAVIAVAVTALEARGSDQTITLANVLAIGPNGETVGMSQNAGTIWLSEVDSDQDGVPDWIEFRLIEESSLFETLADIDATTDIDGDGWPAFEEELAGVSEIGDATRFPGWQMTISGITSFSRADILKFGYTMDPADAQVPARGESRLVLLGENGSHLSSDLRASALSHTWLVESSDPAPVTLKWSAADVAEYHELQIREQFGVHIADTLTGTAVALADDTSFVIQPGQTIRIDFSRKIDEVALVPGWNLISIPLEPEITDPDQLINRASTIAWQYVLPNRAYRQPLSFASRTGYWVHTDMATAMVVLGSSMLDHTVTVSDGWTLAGFAEAIALPNSTPCYRWDGSELVEMQIPRTAIPREGVWIFSNKVQDIGGL